MREDLGEGHWQPPAIALPQIGIGMVYVNQ